MKYQECQALEFKTLSVDHNLTKFSDFLVSAAQEKNTMLSYASKNVTFHTIHDPCPYYLEVRQLTETSQILFKGTFACYCWNNLPALQQQNRNQDFYAPHKYNEG